jgi:transcriptional regulator GlxA family with amidase domain
MRVDRDSLYTLDELAKLLDVSKRTLERAVKDGRLPVRYVSAKPFVSGADLLDNLPSTKPSPTKRGTRKAKK